MKRAQDKIGHKAVGIRLLSCRTAAERLRRQPGCLHLTIKPFGARPFPLLQTTSMAINR
jgi:hypothetical protein